MKGFTAFHSHSREYNMLTVASRAEYTDGFVSGTGPACGAQSLWNCCLLLFVAELRLAQADCTRAPLETWCQQTGRVKAVKLICTLQRPAVLDLLRVCCLFCWLLRGLAAWPAWTLDLPVSASVPYVSHQMQR